MTDQQHLDIIVNLQQKQDILSNNGRGNANDYQENAMLCTSRISFVYKIYPDCANTFFLYMKIREFKSTIHNLNLTQKDNNKMSYTDLSR